MDTQTFHFEIPSHRQDVIKALESIMKAFKIKNESKNIVKDDKYSDDMMRIMSFAGIIKTKPNFKISDDLKQNKLTDKEYMHQKYGI